VGFKTEKSEPIQSFRRVVRGLKATAAAFTLTAEIVAQNHAIDWLWMQGFSHKVHLFLRPISHILHR